jgi:hypothetical protein
MRGGLASELWLMTKPKLSSHTVGLEIYHTQQGVLALFMEPYMNLSFSNFYSTQILTSKHSIASWLLFKNLLGII